MDKQEQLILCFRDLYNKMAWLNKAQMEESLKGYKPSEIHCIEYIGKHVDSNVTRLAESCYMTRGAVSKITQKLLKQGIIESYQKPDNKKEIYFRLTDQGKTPYTIHEELHKAFHQRDKAVFDRLTKEQFDSILSFVEQYSTHLDGEIKSKM